MATKAGGTEKAANKPSVAAASKPRVPAPATAPKPRATTVTPARKKPTAAAPRSAPRKPSKAQGPRMSINVPEPLQREIVGVVVFLIALLTAISLAGSQSSGLLGGWGSFLGTMFGWAAWLVPIAFGAMAVMLFIAGILKIERLRWEMPLGVLMILIAAVGIMHMPLDNKREAAELAQGGGMVGFWISQMFEGVAGRLGGSVILLALAIIGAIMAFHVSLGDLGRSFGRGGGWLFGFFTAPKVTSSAAPVLINPAPPQRARSRGIEPVLLPDVPINSAKNATPVLPATTSAVAAEPLPLRISGGPNDLKKAETPGLPPRPATEVAKQMSLPLPSNTGYIWKLPSIDLLERTIDAEINDDDLRQKARKIEETLATFGVSARVREVNSGPAVTQFALEPGEGVRVAKIAGLANDLALTLAAPSIRIEAPVPGMARVGIEVPNSTPALVGLRNIMEGDTFAHVRGKLKVPFGRDTHGLPVTVDLAKLPHLLIAGATGSGKSVAINSLVISFLMQYTPDELRMLMIDPKRVELSGFNGIPHLLRPVVTEMKLEKEPSRKGPREITAIEVLKWLLWEMERRYKLFARGVKDAHGMTKIYRNIEQYHAAATLDPTMEHVPYIVLIIDELADLMLVAPEDVETSLCRLAQLARATGIHLIVATQRPSVDVVTGLIKANFPARLAFAVTSMIDSRVILDSPGAEKLLGRGDALYTASDESKPIRVQGTWVGDKELDRVVQFWRKQIAPPPDAAPANSDGRATAANGAAPQAGGIALAGQPVQVGSNVPMPDWLTSIDAGDAEANADDEDTVMKEAIALVKKHRYASTSMLQRRLRIGYNRAARLIERMEELGLVGPADGSRSREVLVKDEVSEGGEQ